MTIQLRRGLVAAALFAMCTPAFAVQAHKGAQTSLPADKEQAHARMLAIVQQLDALRATNGSGRAIRELSAELDAISASLGGDKPAHQAAPGALTPTSQSAPQLLAAPTCGGGSLTPVNFAGTTGVIFPAPSNPITPTVFTTTVSGVGTYLWDLNLNTTILHTNPTDLDITLTSPAGTVVVISTDNGGASDNVFNGTVWDEQQTGQLNTVVDRVYANNVTSTPLNSEGRMEAFRGEDPNGTWTLTISDDLNLNTGSVTAWSIDVSTIPAPSETTTTFSLSPALAIPDVATVTSTIAVSGVGTFISGITLDTTILHTWTGDMDITLTSPAGTVVKIATDVAETGEDNVFNGTRFSGDAPLALTDVIFVNNVTVPLVGSEGSLENFRGQDPNGNWVLTITDDTATDVGTLVAWAVNVTTTSAPTVSGPTNFAGTTGPITDASVPVTPPVTPTIFTATVSGVGTVLWDVDLTTFITHTFAADLDMTLTSPAGTVVTVSTDNGAGNDNVFNGTLWDDNSSDLVTDHVYANLTLASPLSPEGRFSAFRGQDPNGVWTLTITDDVTGTDFGSLNAWSLDIAATTSAPVPIPTTFSQSPNLAIPANAIFTGSDTIAVSGLGTYLLEVEVYVEVTHTWAEDVNLSLTSPSGTIVQLTTINGAGNDNVYNGTLFTGTVTDTVTDHLYTNLVTATPLSPEGSFDPLIGQDPNGNWTLTEFDPVAFDGGTFVRWDLTIKTCVGSGSAFCTNSSLNVDHTTGCPCGNTGAAGNGCGHSFDPNGANISATGTISPDTIVLHTQFEPASSFTLMMQHANSGDTIFHDGVLCAANPLIRLRGRAAVGGEAFFPNSNFANDSTTTLSARGGTFPGSGATMRYAGWYRNASSTFCPPATANVTNGWVITW